ncbi:MAG: ATP-binding protein [Oceanipulchritudo sp.]
MNRISPARLLSLVLTCLILPLTLPAQVPVRNAVAETDANPMLLLDGLPGAGWESTGAASRASFLLDDPTLVEAAYVMASGGEAAPAYALMGSTNYRNWFLLHDGLAEGGVETGEPQTFDPREVLYLRLQSHTEAPVSWELATGETDAVRDRVELWKPVDWGDITDPSVILEMLDRAFSWQVERQTTRQGGIGWVNGAFHTGVSAMEMIFSHVSRGPGEIILVPGHSGVGKTSLEEWLKTPVHAKNGLFIQSKFDQYLRVGVTRPALMWCNRVD